MGKWEEVKLGKLCQIIGGGTPSKNSKEFYNGQIPWASVRDMNSEVIEETEFKITEEAVKNSSTNIIKKGSIIIATRVGLGKVCFAGTDIAINQDLKGIIVNDLINNRYLFFYFKSIEQFLIESGTGATVKGVKLDLVKNLIIPLPPLPEQERLVAKLDGLFEKIDEAMRLLEENTADTESLMGSVLDEEFGKLNCEWFKLEEITKVIGGGTPKTANSEYWADEIVWLSPVDLPPIGVISKVSDSGKKISQLGLQKSSAKLLPIGTVVFSSRASIGKIAITECELATNQGFTNFVPNEGVNNMYLAKTLKHYILEIEALSNSTTFKEVSKTSLKNFKIPLPKIETQLRLSKLFSEYQKNIDGIVNIQTEKLTHLKALKRSLLDQAFKGEL